MLAANSRRFALFRQRDIGARRLEKGSPSGSWDSERHGMDGTSARDLWRDFYLNEGVVIV